MLRCIVRVSRSEPRFTLNFVLHFTYPESGLSVTFFNSI